MKLRILSVIVICACLLGSLVACGDTANGTTPTPSTPVATTSPEADFNEDTVLVIMTKAASLQFRTYTPEDFPELSCVSVNDLSTSAGSKTRDQLLKAGIDPSTMEINEETVIDSPEFDEENKERVNSYRQGLCIKLAEPGKDKVLAAIEILKQRDDVLTAEPDYVLTFD